MESSIYITMNEGNLSVKLDYLIEQSKNLFDIQPLDYTATKGDKFYFLPGVNIPRAKVKTFNDENGTKTVRDLNTATYIFGSDKSQHEYFKTGNRWIYRMCFEDFERILPDAAKYFRLDPTDVSDLKDIIEAKKITSADNFFVYYSYQTITEINEVVKRFNINDLKDNTWNDSGTYNIVDPSDVDEINELQKVTIYDVNALTSTMSAKNVTIDYEMFGQLTNMFNSNDSDNHVLAMEVMANCNVVDSLLYIEMLFKDHSYTIYNTHTRNHVNFKSLCSVIGKSSYRFGTDIDCVVRSLISFDVLTDDKLNILMKHYHAEIMRNGDSDFFKVKTVTLSDKAHEALGKNYTYLIQDDYKPVVEETEEIVEETPEENVNTESLNIESVTEEVIEEEVSFLLEDVNNVSETEETVRVIETVREENVLPFVENTIEDIKDTEEQVDINPVIKEEDGESEIDWF